MKHKVTVLIEAQNEAKQLKECIASAKLLTDSINLIDQHSTDGSAEVAKKMRVEIIQHDPVGVVEEIREFGIRQVKTPWVFILDADERITGKLAEEIQHVITNDELRITNYKVPRKNIFGRKKWLKHGGWWPDYQIRLIHIPSFKKWPKQIHSAPMIGGFSGQLNAPLEHYFHGDIESMVEKTILFEEKEAILLHRAGQSANTFIFFRKFVGELYRRLIKQMGFLDGIAGIIESSYQAYSKTITYLLLYEKSRAL